MKRIGFRFLVFLAITIISRLSLSAQAEIALSNADDLQKIGVDVAYPIDGSYYLTKDIDLGGIPDWTPIGSTNGNDRFKGIFDGRGFSIKNLTIQSTGGFKGLFVRLYGATVKNFDLINVNIKGSSPIGSVAGAIIGGSLIERVSVSGYLEGITEVGGIVGRVARDPNLINYNVIQDCYVTATIKASSLSTDNNIPSCAGGIVAYTHSVIGNSVAKIEVKRSYFSGSVESAQLSSIAGNAAGILAFYDNHKFVKMSEVLVLADKIVAATPNYFFCRRGVTPDNLELLEKLYVRENLQLTYFNENDKGYGAIIPPEKIDTLPINTFKTAQFYADNLTWDFTNVWTINEGSLPILRRTESPVTKIENSGTTKNYLLKTDIGVLVIEPTSRISLTIFTSSGVKIYSINNVDSKMSLNLSKGVYLIHSSINDQTTVEKIIIK